MSSRYDPVIKVIKVSDTCPEVVFRQAGDRFLEVVYGRSEPSSAKTIKDIILRSVRVVTINNLVKKAGIDGLIETIPGGESLMYVYDPLVVTMEELAEKIEHIERQIEDVGDQVIQTREITIPIAFEHSLIKKAIDKYVQEVNPDAFYCRNGSNLEFIAEYNGISVEELKHKFIDTEWFVSMVGFFPGLPYFYPLNPASAITCPKYNPARTWTPEGAVDLADYCSTIFGVESSGGCQLIGRTVPIFQAYSTHEQFKDNPALFRPTDIIRFYETSEEYIDNIYGLVAEGNWNYKITPRTLSISSWLEQYESKEREAAELREKQTLARQHMQRI